MAESGTRCLSATTSTIHSGKASCSSALPTISPTGISTAPPSPSGCSHTTLGGRGGKRHTLASPHGVKELTSKSFESKSKSSSDESGARPFSHAMALTLRTFQSRSSMCTHWTP